MSLRWNGDGWAAIVDDPAAAAGWPQQAQRRASRICGRRAGCGRHPRFATVPTTSPSIPDTQWLHEPPTERALSTPRAAGAAGLVFAGLFVGAFLLLRSAMGKDVPAATVIQNLSGSGSTAAIVGLYLIPFAGIAFIWFIGVIRDRIGAREDRFFATVFLGSGLLFVAMFFACGAVFGGLVAGARFDSGPVDSSTVELTRSISYTLMFVFAVKDAGVFTIATSTIVWRAGWPRWTYISGYASAAVLLFSVTFYEPIVLIFPAWVSCVSLYVLITGRGIRGPRPEAP